MYKHLAFAAALVVAGPAFATNDTKPASSAASAGALAAATAGASALAKGGSARAKGGSAKASGGGGGGGGAGGAGGTSSGSVTNKNLALGLPSAAALPGDRCVVAFGVLWDAYHQALPLNDCTVRDNVRLLAELGETETAKRVLCETESVRKYASWCQNVVATPVAPGRENFYGP